MQLGGFCLVVELACGSSAIKGENLHSFIFSTKLADLHRPLSVEDNHTKNVFVIETHTQGVICLSKTTKGVQLSE